MNLRQMIIKSQDGGFAVIANAAGASEKQITDYHGTGNEDIWILKIDANGNLLKEKAIGGSGADYGNAIIETSDGGLVVIGSSDSTDGDLTGIRSFGDKDGWIVKLDADLNISWQKKMGGSGPDIFSSITAASDGGVLLAAYIQSIDGEITGSHVTQNNAPGVVSGDFWVVKLNQGGELMWQKALGGSKDDHPNSIIELGDRTIIASGSTQSSGWRCNRLS